MKAQNLVLIFTITFLISCSFSDNELKKGWWKYGSGQHIGDVLNFKTLKVSNDTIYGRHGKIGIIVDREESFFGITSRKIYIKPLIETKDPMLELHQSLKKLSPDANTTYTSPNGVGIYHQK